MIKNLCHCPIIVPAISIWLQSIVNRPIIARRTLHRAYASPKERIELSKRYRNVRVAASLLRSWIDAGMVQVVPKVGGELLQLKTAIYLTFPRLYATRHRRGRRMWVPAGSFLNCRWIPLGPRNTEWDLILTLSEQELKEKCIIICVEENGEERWYRLIYEVISSRSQLLRQRVHIRAKYAHERTRKNVLLQAVEQEFANHVLGKARLTRVELAELSNLHRRLSQRLYAVIVGIQVRLSGRDTMVFFDAWVESEGLRGLRNRLSYLADNLGPEVRRPNFDAHLQNIGERLAIYISPEIRRSVRWARYHILRLVEDVREARFGECKRRLDRSVHHIDVALEKLKEWDQFLPDQEREHIPSL